MATTKTTAGGRSRNRRDVRELLGELVDNELRFDPWIDSTFGDDAQLVRVVLGELAAQLISEDLDVAAFTSQLRVIHDVLAHSDKTWSAYCVVDHALTVERRHPKFAERARRWRSFHPRREGRAARGADSVAYAWWYDDKALTDEESWAAGIVWSLAEDASDPAFARVRVSTAAAAFRDAAKCRMSEHGGAGNKGAWSVLAKLTLDSGALGAPQGRPASPLDVAREVTRLRARGKHYQQQHPSAREEHESYIREEADEQEEKDRAYELFARYENNARELLRRNPTGFEFVNSILGLERHAAEVILARHDWNAEKLEQLDPVGFKLVSRVIDVTRGDFSYLRSVSTVRPDPEFEVLLRKRERRNSRVS